MDKPMQPVAPLSPDDVQATKALADAILSLISGEKGIVAITALSGVLNRVVRSLPDTQRIQVVTHLLDQMI